MSEWKKQDVRLHSHHGWRGRARCKIFVADSGAVRFDYPQDWFVILDEDSVKLSDKVPPNDDSRLVVSYLRLPPVRNGCPAGAAADGAMNTRRRG